MNSTNHEIKNPFATFALRGGRLRRRGGAVVSYAPFLAGMASAVVLGSLLAHSALAQPTLVPVQPAPTLGQSANAETKVETKADYTKVDTSRIVSPAGTTTTTTTTVSANGVVQPATTALPVTDGTATSSTVSFSQETTVTTSGSVSGRDTGVYVSHRGDDDINLVNGADIDDAYYGIRSNRNGDGILKIVNEAAITDSAYGIYGLHVGAGALEIHSSGADAEIGADYLGIYAEHRGSGGIKIVNRAAITGGQFGVYARHAGTGSVEIASSSRVVAEDYVGIYARHTRGGEIEIDLSGEVSSENDYAIEMRSSGAKSLILRPGFSLDGAAVSSGGGTGTLELRAHETDTSSSGVLDLGADEFRGFGAFWKQGDNLWEVRGVASSDEAFGTARIDAGTLRLSGANFAMADNRQLILSKGSKLEIVGSNRVRGHLVNRGGEGGGIVFASEGADDSLTITGDYQGNGSLTFAIGSAGWDDDKLTIEGKTPALGAKWDVSVRTPEAGAPSIATASPVLIEVKGVAHANDFFGEKAFGASVYALKHESVGGVNQWHFAYDRAVETSEIVPPGTSTVTDGTETRDRIGRRSNRRSSFRDDAGARAGGAWAEQQSSRASLAAGSVTNDRIHFGFDFPATSLMGGDVAVGAGVWQGLLASDVSFSTGKGAIGVESHAAVLSALWWSPDGFYADGQAQHVRFSRDMSARGLLLVRDNEGSGASVSAEAGYRFAVPLGGMELDVVPQAELLWSRVGFDDFVGPYGELVSLEDGDLATGRLGLSWDGEWRDVGGAGRVYGEASLRAALDGRTVVSISGVSLADERRSLSLDGRLGVSYEWDEGYAVHGEAVALRRDDAEEVRANLGVRIDF